MGQIVRCHGLRIGLTYGLTCAEKGLQILFPWATGVAIDGLMRSECTGLALLGGIWTLHLASATARQMYDTRLFTSIYSDLARTLIERQRAAGESVSAVSARSALSRECVDFVERDVPTLIQTVLTAGGSLFMMFIYSLPVGVIAASLLVPVTLGNWWFARRALRLNRGINSRLEQEVGVIDANRRRLTARHFGLLRRMRIGLSDAEALSRAGVEVCMIAALAASLTAYTAGNGHTPGMVYAVFVYVWSYFETLWVVPTAVNAITRVQDIGARVQGTPARRDRSTPP